MPGKWENKDDMKKLQQDAIKRVQEMQSRAKEKIAHTTTMTIEREPEESKDSSEGLHREKPRLTLKNGSHAVEDVFQSLMKDSERNLILMVILLLMEEKADSELLLSLMYLII